MSREDSVIYVRPEREGDEERIHEVQAMAFAQENEARLVDLLRTGAKRWISLVAEREGALVGHVAFTPVELETEGRAPEPVEHFAGLAPIAVEPRWQAGGVGAALVSAGLDACEAIGWRAVFLVGAPAYYGRFGFELAQPLGFHYGAPHFDELLQVCTRSRASLEGLSGRIVYHRAFADAGCA